jgi:hypothetical protein
MIDDYLERKEILALRRIHLLCLHKQPCARRHKFLREIRLAVSLSRWLFALKM